MKPKIMFALCILITRVATHAVSDGALYAEAVLNRSQQQQNLRINQWWVDEYGYYPSFEQKAYTHWDDLAVFCGTAAITHAGFMALDKYGKNKLSENRKNSLKKLSACLTVMFGSIGGFLYHMHKCLNYQHIIDDHGLTCRVYPRFGAAESYMKWLYGTAFVVSSIAAYYFIFQDIAQQQAEEDAKNKRISGLTKSNSLELS